MTDPASLDAPWELLDTGRPQDALDLLARLDEQDTPHPEAGPIACLAYCDLGDLEAARTALGPDLEEAPVSWWLARGELALLSWDAERARECLLVLEDDEPSVSTRLRLSLCADLLGEEDEALAWLERARELDPDGPLVHPHLAPDEFDRVVAEAVAELPEVFARRLDVVPVIVEPVPERAVAGPDVPPDALGLFRGANDLERSIDGDADLPPAIHLFQRNLERRARDVDELREEIRITLYHELGHLLGFDEEGVDELGLA